MRSTSQGHDAAGLTDNQALATLPRLQEMAVRLADLLDSNALRAVVRSPDNQLLDWLMRELKAVAGRQAGVATMSGARSSRVESLNSALAQFGYDFASDNLNELMGMLRVFAVHQTDTGVRPLLIVREADRLRPSLLEMLAEIESFKAGRQPAINIVLFGAANVMDELRFGQFKALETFAPQNMLLKPLSAAEVVRYMKARTGITVRDLALLERLIRSTDGRAHRIDRLLTQARQWPEAEPEVALGKALDHHAGSQKTDAGEPEAQLLVSQKGRLLSDHPIHRKRIMIGRAEHNDLALESRYISRYHALIIQGPEDAHWVIDLNSRNGTFVNSRAVDFIALRHNDIVAMGNHRIKYQNPDATGVRPDRAAFAGSATAVFETLKADGGPDLSVLTQNLRQPG